uniref:BTB domain-containing protein n=1 Tax=Setaria digitata TaxID=48799 RepID=A0A915Q504_9BILA
MELATVAKPESTLTELIFIHKKLFKLSGQENSVFNLSTSFYTNYGPRSVRWSICFSGYTTIAVNSTDSYSIPPRGKYKISAEATSKQNKEISTELVFERSLIDVWNSEFLTKILKILNSPDFSDSVLKLRYELRFEAHEFIQVCPWLFSTAFATPNIPSNIRNDDYRSVMYAKAVENPDFTIHTKNGTIETVRYLLYLTIDHIHSEIDANPTIRSIVIGHRKESVQQGQDSVIFVLLDCFHLKIILMCAMLSLQLPRGRHRSVSLQMINYALKGSFDLMDASPDVLDDFISYVDEVLQYLSLSAHHRLHELCSKAIILVANVHYRRFMLEYNVDSKGSKLEIYNMLKNSELPFEGNAIQKIQAVYYAGKQTEILLRYKVGQEKEESMIDDCEHVLCISDFQQNE